MKKRNMLRRQFFIAKTVMCVFFSLYAASLLFPILWAFLISLKSQVEVSTYNPLGLPQKWLFSNYLEAFKVLNVQGTNMIGMIFNSLWITISALVISLTCTAMVSYVLAKYKFPGGGFLFNMVIVTMMIPIFGSLPSTYMIMSRLHMIDNPPMYLLTCFGGLGGNMLLLRAYFKTLPWSLAEAAFIDGAGHVRVFIQVMMPQAFVVITSLFALGFIGGWNNYEGPMLWLRSYPTLASGLYIFQMITTRQQNIPVLFAGLIFSAIPVVVLFAFYSDKIMDLTLGGGLKG